LDDAKEYIQSAWSKRRDYLPFGTRKSRPADVGRSKAAFLENYLAVSTWILDGSSIECHKKKRQRFSLSGVRFGSGFKFLERSKMSFPPLIPFHNVLCKQSTQTHQIAQIHHLEPQKFCYEQNV